MPRNPTSYRLSEECLRLIALLAKSLGINQTAVVEQAVRKLARAELPADDLSAKKRQRPRADSRKNG
jgi:hypothetical protein